MWLSAALLPCGEAVAATAASANELALSDCGCPADEAPDSGGGGMTGVCLVIAAPVRAPVESLVVEKNAGFNEQTQVIAGSFQVLAPRTVLLPSVFQYWAAPPPVAVYLRNSRLLI
jgi:hypothetical protein